MTERRTWIIGSGGLLGAALLQSTQEAGHPVRRSTVPWSDEATSIEALGRDADSFLDGGDLDLFWCAGAGVVASGPTELGREARVFESFLAALKKLTDDRGTSLRIFLASSAGGVYAGSEGSPFSEATTPRPISPYGEHKWTMERILLERASEAGWSVLLGRIANLYGPGQDLGKPQGLITQLCRAQLQRTPLSIYVPLDTARDYLFVTDAARMIGRGMDLLRDQPLGTPVTRILGSGSAVTLAEIIGELHHITRRRPPVVLGVSPHTRFQVKDLRFRSQVWPSLDAEARTTLPAGIAATLTSVARQLAIGARAS